MKLQTQHLSDYLPYELKCLVVDSEGKMHFATLCAVYNDGSACFCDLVESDPGFESIKPILHPFRADDEYITQVVTDAALDEDEAYMHLDVISQIEEKQLPISLMSHKLWKILVAAHVDVYDLIPKGLAVNYSEAFIVRYSKSDIPYNELTIVSPH